MTDEEANKGVNIQQPASAEAKTDVQGQVQPPASSKENVENSKEYNFSRLRQKNEELERKVNELNGAFQREQASRNPPPRNEEDELNRLDPNDIMTVEQARKLSAISAKRIVQEELDKREKAILPQKVRSQYSDFDHIVTEDNIKKLETEEPGLASACASAANPWEATYKILKKFIVPPKEEKANKAEEKMNDNLSKPASVHSVGRQGPLSNANLWAEASKEELYKEMMAASRR